MILNLTYYSAEPIHNQIMNQILLRIFEEDKLPGDQLDSIGKISRQHHIRKESIKKAFQKLEQLGVVHSLSSEKYFVSDISTRALKTLIDRNYYNSQNFSEYDLLKTELNAARQIQNGLLPKELPCNDLLDVSAYSTISDEVGGDFYDFFEIENNKYGLLIGDASGKGFPAAMLISQIQAIIKSDVSLKRSITQTVHLINSYLSTYSASKYFATLFYGILHLEAKTLTYINAGHNFPIAISNNLQVERLKTTGPALGLMVSANYEEITFDISNNNLLFLFTDGLSERMNYKADQFGEEKIIDLIKKSNGNCSKAIVEKMNSSVQKFSNNTNESDDTTYMVVKIKKVDV